MPDFDSRSASFCSMALRVAGSMMLAWSTTRPESAGKLSAKAPTIAKSRAARAATGHRTLLPRAEEVRPPVILVPLYRHGSSEFHLRRLGRIFGRGELRHRFVTAENSVGPDKAWERPQLGIVETHRFDVVAPGDRNAVLGALELRLQRQEVLIGFKIGIILAHGDEPAECAAQLILRLLELSHLVRIGELRGVHLDLCRLGPRLDNLRKDLSLLLGISLNGGDQIWDEIGPALIVVLHISPLCLGLLLESRDRVVAASGNRKADKNDGENPVNMRHRDDHRDPLIKLRKKQLGFYRTEPSGDIGWPRHHRKLVRIYGRPSHPIARAPIGNSRCRDSIVAPP